LIEAAGLFSVLAVEDEEENMTQIPHCTVTAGNKYLEI
jgi:hypothetical protein